MSFSNLSFASSSSSLKSEWSLSEEVSQSLMTFVIEHLWGCRQPSQLPHLQELSASFEPYFRYYAQQCDLIGRHANGKYSSVETHHDVMDLAHILQTPLSRQEVQEKMSLFLRESDEEQHSNSINLVTRLLLMTKFGDVPHECRGDRPIEWDHGTFPEFVHEYFSRAPVRSHERVKLDKQFKILNLQRIAGIKIWWTNNLADHLRMRDDDQAVEIFYHASFLEYQLHNPIFPPNFIQETLRTIALLFPKHDRATKKWYQNIAAERHLDTHTLRIGNLNAENRQIENFSYWHDRLVILKEVYDEARPSTITQWWYDRRNGPQWYTFWVALLVLILTTIFGIVQCIEGGIQADRSLNP